MRSRSSVVNIPDYVEMVDDKALYQKTQRRDKLLRPIQPDDRMYDLAILNLPKGTEHFMTDIHGESEQFNHILKNGSGSVRRKINEEFGNTMSERE